jgi:Mg2+-importing ATPase
MVEFGALSSVFDLLTFATLLAVFHAPPALFRTAWFVESLLTELLIALVVRTRRAFFRSRPGRLLLAATLILIPITFAIPFLPYASVLGFVPLPAAIVAVLVAITLLYVVATELTKTWFYRHAA